MATTTKQRLMTKGIMLLVLTASNPHSTILKKMREQWLREIYHHYPAKEVKNGEHLKRTG